MSEARDPAIKLFGRTIALPESQAAEENVESPDPATDCNVGEETMEESMETSNVESKVSLPEGLKEPVWNEPDSSSTLNGAIENGFLDPKKDGTASNPKVEQEQNESDGSTQQKVLKKPDKILPCPRCNSLDTKFCYYNNYNVNQPRHFCKNCQRYWTAGGTMRNVPVGAGRRKNKHSASQCRHVLMPTEILPAPHSQVDQTNPVHDQVVTTGGLSSQAGLLKSNGTALKVVADAPLRDSMASVLNLRDQSKSAATSPALCGENGEAPFCASSSTALNGLERKYLDSANNMKQNDAEGSFIGPSSMHHLQCYPGMPWGYPWSSGWNGVAPMVSSQCPELMFGQDKINSKLVTWNPPLIMAAPPFCSPTIPFPFIPASLPASFWGCVASWPSSMWNMPWMETSSGPSPSSSASNGGSAGNSSPTLGKHSRDTDLRFEEKKEKSLWVPKTLRIDDPDEAARSSIWATLGINPDPSEPSKKAGIFRAFQPKTEGKDNSPEGTQVMYANPAALSRSRTFQEST